MWSKCEKCVTLSRFERVDFKLHYVSPESAKQGCKVPNYLEAKPVNVQLIEAMPTLKNLHSNLSENENCWSDAEEQPQANCFTPKSGPGSVQSSSHHDSVPELIESCHDSLAEYNASHQENLEATQQKDSTLTLTVDAENQTDNVASNEDSSNREIQLVEQLNLSARSIDVGTQTGNTDLIDDETQTVIDYEIRDVTLGFVEEKHPLVDSNADESEQVSQIITVPCFFRSFNMPSVKHFQIRSYSLISG